MNMDVTSSWSGTEHILHFSAEASAAGELQLVQPTGEHFDLASTVTTSAKIESPAAWGHELLQPGFDIPIAALTLAGTAIGTAIGYRIHQRRVRKEEATSQTAEDIQAASEPTELAITHKAGALVLKNLLADVSISDGAEDNEISLTVSGKKSRVEKVKFDMSSGDYIVVEGPARSYIKANLLGSIGNNTVLRWLRQKLSNVSGLEVVNDSDVMQITASVPSGSNLEIRRVDGTVNGSGQFGDLVAETAHEATIKISTVKGVDLSSDSYSVVNINDMDGPLNANVGFESNVTIGQGSVSSITSNVESYGKLRVGAKSEDVTVNCGFEGRVELATASGNVELTADSYGRIAVAGGAAETLHISAGFESGIEFGGSAEDAQLSSDSYGKVTVGKIDGELTLNGGFESRTKIGQGSRITNANVNLNSYAHLAVKGHLDDGIVNIGHEGRVSAYSRGPRLSVNKDSYGRFTLVSSSANEQAN